MAWGSGVRVYTEHSRFCTGRRACTSRCLRGVFEHSCDSLPHFLKVWALESKGGGAGRTRPRWPIRPSSGSSCLSVAVCSLTMATSHFLAWVLVLTASSVPSGKTLDTGLGLHTMRDSFTSKHYHTGAAGTRLLYLQGHFRVYKLYELILRNVFFFSQLILLESGWIEMWFLV